jgi:hypothetical protein
MKTTFYLLCLFIMSAFSIYVTKKEFVVIKPVYSSTIKADEILLQNKCKRLIQEIKNENKKAAKINQITNEKIQTLKQNDTNQNTIIIDELHHQFCHEE